MSQLKVLILMGLKSLTVLTSLANKLTKSAKKLRENFMTIKTLEEVSFCSPSVGRDMMKFVFVLLSDDCESLRRTFGISSGSLQGINVPIHY